MRTPSRYVFAGFAALALFVSCGQETEAPPPVIDNPDKGDLERVRERGTLRVIVPRLSEGCLPRQGMPAAEERELARSFAERLGVDVEFICTEDRRELLQTLEAGNGDIVAANLAATPERKSQYAFTRPTATASEWLVGAKGADDLPRSLADLEGREVHVRGSSSFASTLRRLADESDLNIHIIAVDERLDTETLVFEVSEGKRPLTVALNTQIESIESYNSNIEPLFPLVEGQQIGWAVRKGNPELLASANQFITEHFMTEHRRALSTGDVDTVRYRKVLRVLTSNNAVNYFLYRGQQMGFDYEVAKMASSRLGVRLEMVVPPRFEQLIPWLLEGRGDVIAASLTITPDRQEQIEFSIPYFYVDEILVQATDSDNKLSAIEDLRGQTVHVQKSSSYYQTLLRLQPQVGPFTIIEAPEELEIEDLLAQVAEGRIGFTIADSHLLDAELTYRDDIEAAFPLTLPDDSDVEGSESTQNAIAFGVRKENPRLKAFLGEFVKDIYRSFEYNLARNRYFQAPHNLRRIKEGRATVSGRVSPYDQIVKKYAKRYGLDWRLLAAQAYEESRFNPGATSWAGAQGLFQVMPNTGLELGFPDLYDVEMNTRAGTLHMYNLIERMDSRIPFEQRVRFALAAYNAGWGHMQDARRLAEGKGWDSNKWFGHAENAMLLLEQPLYHRQAQFGYVRGSEPVAYVMNIQQRYDHYVSLLPE